MKIETAKRYAAEIARRVMEVNGIILTPRGEREFVKIKRIWVFGSTVKGSLNPNDLDLLIDLKASGNWQEWEDVGFDPEYLRRYGRHTTRQSSSEALMWLTKGMRNVSRHCTDKEKVEIDVKVMIYPIFELQM